MEEETTVYCPLVDTYIYEIYCEENLLGACSPEVMEEWYAPRYKKKKN